MNPFWKFATLVCPRGRHGLESNPYPGTCGKGASSSAGLRCLLGCLNLDKQALRYEMLQQGLACFLFLPLSGVTPCASTDINVSWSSHRPAPHSSGWSAWGVTPFQHLGCFWDVFCVNLFSGMDAPSTLVLCGMNCLPGGEWRDWGWDPSAVLSVYTTQLDQQGLVCFLNLPITNNPIWISASKHESLHSLFLKFTCLSSPHN